MKEEDYDILSRLRKVSANEIVAEACLEYFNKFPENKAVFLEELVELRWRNKFVGSYRNHISLTAVPLALKIHEQLAIITFPFIERTTSRGWGTSGGTWAWAMKQYYQGGYIGTVGSCDPVNYCLRKTIELSQLGSGEISGDKVMAWRGK